MLHRLNAAPPVIFHINSFVDSLYFGCCVVFEIHLDGPAKSVDIGFKLFTNIAFLPFFHSSFAVTLEPIEFAIPFST